MYGNIIEKKNHKKVSFSNEMKPKIHFKKALFYVPIHYKIKQLATFNIEFQI